MFRSQLQLQPLQVGTNFCCRLITCDKVLLDSFMDEVFQLCWNLRIQIAARSRCLIKFGEAEVQYLRLAAFGNEDICWLDVAMNNAFLVRGFEPVRNLDGSIQQRLELKRRLGLRVCFRRNYVAQCPALK